MQSRNTYRSTLLRTSVLTGIASVLFLTPQALAQSAEMETVVITGYRASLEKALDVKRDSVGVRDSIVAEDIGKFPATNIADSLQRVPGVALNRDSRSDEGKSVAVRGLNPGYTVVTINGNPVHASTNNSIGSNQRSVDLDLFSADLFGRVDFYKSPQANLDEGGIGGVIDLRTPHPFDYNGMKVNYSASYNMNSNRMTPLPGATFQASNTWGPFGLLFAATFRESDYELFSHETTGVTQTRNEQIDGTVNPASPGSAIKSPDGNYYRNPNGMTFDDYGTPTAGSLPFVRGSFDPRSNIGSYTWQQVDQAFIGRFERNHIEQNKTSRMAGLLSLQFRPNEKWDVTLDMMGALYNQDHNEYTLGLTLRSMSTTAAGWTACQANSALIGQTNCRGNVPINIKIDQNNNIYGTFGNTQWLAENRWYEGYTHFASVDLKAKYQATDNLVVNFEASENASNGQFSDDRIYAVAVNTTSTFDPTVNYKIPLLSTTADLTNPALFNMSLGGVDAAINKEGDKVLIGKINAVYDVNTGVSVFGKLKADVGLSYVSSQKTNWRGNGASLVKARGMYAGGTVGSRTYSQFATNHIPLDNLFDGQDVPEGRIMNWAGVSRSVYEAIGFNSLVKNATAEQLQAYGTTQYANMFNVTEAVQSAYFMLNTDGELFGHSLKINGGLRYAQTRLWGYNWKKCPDGSGYWCHNALQNKYDNVLPTISIAYDVMDDFVARAAYGKTVSRPGLGNIAGGKTIPGVFNASATNGNDQLKPMIANNVDVGLEWYFMPESVLSVGVYYKGVKGLIANQTTTTTFGALGLPENLLNCSVFCDGTGHIPADLSMTLSHPVNLNPVMVKGFEIFYQQPFSFLPEPFDGLGALANFTYTAGKQSGPNTGFNVNTPCGPGATSCTNWTAPAGFVVSVPEQINGLSPYTYSATLYYEKGGLSVRASYNWRSKFVSISNNYYETNGHMIGQARGTLDGTVGYSFFDKLEVRLDVTNLLDAVEYQYLAPGVNGINYPGRYAQWGDNSSHVFYSMYHGRNFTLSLRGHL